VRSKSARFERIGVLPTASLSDTRLASPLVETRTVGAICSSSPPQSRTRRRSDGPRSASVGWTGLCPVPTGSIARDSLTAAAGGNPEGERCGA
jgi:hypothetical protein